MSKEKKVYGFCHRCEWRAQNKETGRQPRCECGSNSSVCGCYMYKPVAPHYMIPREDDPRPQFAGAMFSARSSCGGPLEYDDTSYQVLEINNKPIQFVIPKGYHLEKNNEEE